jgi:ATP-dependent helicase IRC3
MFELRDYQQECLNRIYSKMKEGVRLQVIVMATGTGKTCIFAQLPKVVKRSGKKTLVLAHREELLTQARDKILAVSPELKVEIEQ